MAKYKGELKSIQKTIRMTEAVYDHINSMEGDGFNQKFENAILMEEKKQLKLQDVEERYENIQKEVLELEEYRAALRRNIQQLEEVKSRVELIISTVDDMDVVLQGY